MHHENTRLYKEMLLLVEDCARIARTVPRGYAFLADQIATRLVRGAGDVQ